MVHFFAKRIVNSGLSIPTLDFLKIISLFLCMEKFRTEVEISQPEFSINYQHRIMTLGSCFAENIGNNMHDMYLDVDVNPFGVLYNPMSILQSIEMLISKKQFTDKDIFVHRGLWNSFSHSSQFSDTKPEHCLEKINARLNASSVFFENANVLLLTFGTAWVYEDRESNRIVSNCHKLPSSFFVRRKLSIDEIVNAYSTVFEKLQKINPSLKLIFSVSPVRHLKDTAHGNNLSKSVLLLAIDSLCSQFENAFYYPAYEILLDELRDYRFFADDMVHPSEVAVQYIWKKFTETYFDKESQNYLQEVKQLNNDLNHRPFFPESEEFEVFKTNLNKRKAKLIEKYPMLKNKLVIP